MTAFSEPRRSIVRVNTVAVALLAAFVIAMSVPTIFVESPFAPHGSFGIDVTTNGFVDGVFDAFWAKHAGVPVSDAASAGIVEGDRIDYAAMPPDQRYGRFFDREAAAGTTATFRVVHRGAARDVRLTARVYPYNRLSPLRSALFVLEKLSVAMFILIAATIVIARPLVTTWSFFLYALGAQFHSIPRFWSFLPEVWYVSLFVLMNDVLVGTAVIGFLMFALRFPDGAVGGWRKTLERCVLAAALPMVGLTVAADFAGPIGPIGPDQWRFIWWLSLVCSYVLGLTALGTTFRASRGSDRRRVEWVIAALAFTFGGSLIAILGNVIGLSDELMPVAQVLFVLDVVAGIALGYAVLRYRVLDVRFALNRALTYAIVTTLLAMLLVVTYRFADTWLQRSGLALAIQAGLAIAIGVALQRSYRTLDVSVSRAFFRAAYEAQQRLAALAEALPHAGSVRELETLVVREPMDALALSSAALFRLTAGGRYALVYAAGERNADFEQIQRSEPVVRYLESRNQPLTLRSRSAASPDPSLAVPIRVANELHAILLYGPHRNGSAVDPDERAALQRVAEAAAVAFAVHRQRQDEVRTLSALLATGGAGTDDVASYLAEQLLDRVPPEEYNVLFACASLGEAGGDEIAVATGDPAAAAAIADLCSRSPLVRRTGTGTYSAHAVLVNVANRSSARRDDVVRRVAASAGAAGDHERAARRYASIGAGAEAACELELAMRERIERGSALLDEADVAAAVSRDETARRPALWAAALAARLGCESPRTLRGDLAAVRARGAPHEAAMQTWFAAWDAYLAVLDGSVDDAEAALPALPSGSTEIDRFARCVRALADGRRGRVSAARAAANDELAHPLALQVLASCVERPLGSFDTERIALDAAGDRGALAAEIAAERVVNAWLAGDSEGMVSALGALRGYVDRGASSYRHLAGRGAEVAAELVAATPWRWLAYGELIGISSDAAGGDASTRAARAVSYADRAGAAFERVLARIAQAHVTQAVSEPALAEARAIAGGIDSPPLTAAVDAVIAEDDDTGMLRAVLTSMRGAGAQLHVELLRGMVRRGGTPIALSEKELALLCALAAQATPVAAPELVDRLWPEQTEQAGTKALQVTIHRLRRRLDDTGAIVTTSTGYALREDVSADLGELESMLRYSAAGTQLDDFARLRLRAVSNRVQRATTEYADFWDWFAGARERIANCGRTADLRLAQDALARADFREAQRCVDRLILRDPFDEPACEVSLRLRLQSGDRAGALREYRLYRDRLKSELSSEPAEALVALMASARSAPTHG